MRTPVVAATFKDAERGALVGPPFSIERVPYAKGGAMLGYEDGVRHPGR
jgi:hypothetical protein